MAVTLVLYCMRQNLSSVYRQQVEVPCAPTHTDLNAIYTSCLLFPSPCLLSVNGIAYEDLEISSDISHHYLFH